MHVTHAHRDHRDAEEREACARCGESVDAVGEIDRVAGGDQRGHRKNDDAPAQVGRAQAGKVLMGEACDQQREPQQEPDETLDDELVSRGETEPAAAAYVDDVVESAHERATHQREDRDESFAAAIDRQPRDHCDGDEEQTTERGRPLLDAMRERAVGGDMLADAGSHECGHEQRVERHAGGKADGADDDRVLHGVIRHWSTMMRATSRHTGAARSAPKRGCLVSCG